MALAATGAMIGTAAWATLLSVDIRAPIIVAGVVCAVSVVVVPFQHEPLASWKLVLSLGTLLCAYQYCTFTAVATGGAAVQTVINCNIVLICVYEVYAGTLHISPTLILLVFSTCASSAGLMIYVKGRATVVGA